MTPAATHSAMPISLSHLPAGSPWWLVALVIVGLAVHIGGGSIGIISGYGAVFVRKGGGWHARFGKVFLWSMMFMGAAAAALAIFIQQRGNIAGGFIAAYLVATGYMTIKRKPGTIGPFEGFAALVIFATSAALLFWGLDAKAHPVADDPAAPYFVFAAAAAFFGALDVLNILRGGATGSARLARHLWRMCFALFFAAGSFFIGQQKVMPLWMQGSPVLYVLGLAPLAFLVFWMIRIRFPFNPFRKAGAAT